MSDQQAVQNTAERRQFSRFLFNADCRLQQSGFEWMTELLDISLNGVLVKKPDLISLDIKEPCEATIILGGTNNEIRMTLDHVHSNSTSIGFKCKHIDIDSMTHLKRLVELNIGDETMLQRELSLLSLHK